jgi:cyclopropane fatty-acyl-phospholipid synthase-like methyltransferase
MKSADLDEIYRMTPLKDIPWNNEEPPQVLVDLVESAKVVPCKAVDLGCGAGNYAVYLARKGFTVTGVDLSPTAISLARENARRQGVKCHFLAADVTGDLAALTETFDFAFDWELLHHLFPEQRNKYVPNVWAKLNPRGRYLSFCFSEQDAQFGGKGQIRQTPLGTVLYFSSETELRDLFSPWFKILDLRTVSLPGKRGSHLAICVFMEKRAVPACNR